MAGRALARHPGPGSGQAGGGGWPEVRVGLSDRASLSLSASISTRIWWQPASLTDNHHDATDAGFAAAAAAAVGVAAAAAVAADAAAAAVVSAATAADAAAAAAVVVAAAAAAAPRYSICFLLLIFMLQFRFYSRYLFVVFIVVI